MLLYNCIYINHIYSYSNHNNQINVKNTLDFHHTIILIHPNYILHNKAKNQIKDLEFIIFILELLITLKF